MLEKQLKTALMQEALQEARAAADIGEIPIGAIVATRDGQIIGRGHNLREHTNDATTHAEILAIREANQHLGSWRLEDCVIFVSLEPCPMCAGAILNSRLAEVYFGAFDPKAGAMGSVLDLFSYPKFNHHPEVYPGLFQDQAAQMLKDFFRQIREQKKLAQK